MLQDKFKFSCFDWEDQHTPLQYKFFIYIEGVLKMVCNGKFSFCNAFLPIGEEEKEYNLPVFVSISDRLGGSTTISVNVTVSKSSSFVLPY